VKGGASVRAAANQYKLGAETLHRYLRAAA